MRGRERERKSFFLLCLLTRREVHFRDGLRKWRIDFCLDVDGMRERERRQIARREEENDIHIHIDERENVRHTHTHNNKRKREREMSVTRLQDDEQASNVLTRLLDHHWLMSWLRMVNPWDWEDWLEIHWMLMKEMKSKMKMIVVVVVELMEHWIFHLNEN